MKKVDPSLQGLPNNPKAGFRGSSDCTHFALDLRKAFFLRTALNFTLQACSVRISAYATNCRRSLPAMRRMREPDIRSDSGQ